MRRHVQVIVLCLFSTIILFSALFGLSVKANAEEDDDPVIIVSLGDSYSSGEGITPFYGQDQAPGDKVTDEDWVAHRSTLSWHGLLEVPTENGTSGPMNQYREDPIHHKYSSASPNYQWYFVAASGATTEDFYSAQHEAVDRWFDGRHYEVTDYPLPHQFGIFDYIDGTVDYVVFTIGGNDVGFSTVIKKVFCGINFLGINSVDSYINETWKEFYSTKRDKIKQTYRDVAEKAPEATILVVGYPKLLSLGPFAPKLVSPSEVTSVNKAVSQFNDELEKMVGECQGEGINIEFVDVETEFDGHEAYTVFSWINPLMVPFRSEDLKELPYSNYSIHPNEEGARHYAKCVNAKIAEIEERKRLVAEDVFKSTDGEVLVRTDYKESGTVSIEFDTYCHPYDYSYRRPQFTIKSADAEEMNQEIKADFKAVVEDYGGNGIYYGVYNTVSYENSLPYDEIANDNSGIFKRVIDYDSAVFNDILSVRVTDTNCVTWKNTDWEVSTVYTLDLTDGSRLTGKDVLNRIGMGQQDLLDRLYWEIERESKDLIFSIELFDPESDEIPDWLQSDIDGEINASLTLNDFDEILENGIYLNQNGHLEVRLMMQLGAASEYTIIVDIDPTPTDFPTDSPSDYNVGCWIGGFGSVIVLREDHSALYCEPENQNRPELQAGIECTWDYVNGYPSLTGENLDYDLYMERHHDSDGMLVYANDERWTPEIFQLCPGLSEEEAKKGLQYNPCEIMFAIGDWSSIETFAQDNGLELMAGGERDYFSLFSSDGPEKASVLTIGQYTLDDAIYASCDGPCEITLCGVKVGDSIEKAEDNVPRYGSVYATEGYTDYNGDDVAIIHLGARNGFHYSVQYTISENTIISWYVYTVDSDYDIGVDRITETFITTGVHQFIISHPGYWTDHVRFEETPEGNWRIFNIENETAETDGLLGEIVFSDFQSRQRLVDYCAELNERYGDAFRMLDRNEIPVVYASEWSGGIIYVSMAWGSGHYTAENKDLYMKLYSVFYEARNTITVQ